MTDLLTDVVKSNHVHARLERKFRPLLGHGVRLRKCVSKAPGPVLLHARTLSSKTPAASADIIVIHSAIRRAGDRLVISAVSSGGGEGCVQPDFNGK